MTLFRLPPVAAFAATLLLAACGDPGQPDASGGGGGGGGGGAPFAPKRVGHVFVIVLENKNYADTFAADAPPAPYLARTLVAQGAFLQNYWGVAHVSLPNYIALLSGQGPNMVTQSDCQFFQDFAGGDPAVGPDGQFLGQGCVYPAEVPELATQLAAKGLTWKGYMEDMGNDPARDNTVGTTSACGHPPVNDSAPDATQSADATDQYATRHNPFVYFHSIIDDEATCAQRVLPLDALTADLASLATTPNFTFITPDLCSDGHDETCADATQKGGYEGIDDFLGTWVPRITASAAFKKDGLLIVTFDEADVDPTAGPQGDASACCAGFPTPNTPMPGIFGTGGGKVGAVLLSPFIKPGTVVTTEYNHYSLLRSVEDFFGLGYLGYAGADGSVSFGDDVFTAAKVEFPPK